MNQGSCAGDGRFTSLDMPGVTLYGRALILIF